MRQLKGWGLLPQNIFMRHKLISGLLIVMILNLCSEKITRSNEVIVHATKMDWKELELKINRKGQGWSLHNFSWDKYNVDESYWIYVPMKVGRVVGSEIQFSNQRNTYIPTKTTRDLLTLTLQQ